MNRKRHLFMTLAISVCIACALSVPAVNAGEGHRASYYMDGEIHVNELGTPEEEPLTTGHWDFKPSWSKTGDMLVALITTPAAVGLKEGFWTEGGLII